MIFSQMIINFFFKKLAVVGQENVNRAASISKEGLSFFNKGLYVEAALEFENASTIDSLSTLILKIPPAHTLWLEIMPNRYFSDKVITQF